MATDGIYKKCKCASLIKSEQHIVTKPKLLECGHFICKKCIPPQNKQIKCNHCKIMTKLIEMSDLTFKNENNEADELESQIGLVKKYYVLLI